MKNKYIILGALMVLFTTVKANAQQGFGTSNPAPSSVIDMVASNKGALLPRVALTSTTVAAPVTAPANALTVFNTATTGDVTPGYYYWSTADSKWIKLIATNDLQEPWKIQATTNNAALNTDNIYQQGKVAIGTTSATAASTYQLDVAGDFKTSYANGGIYNSINSNYPGVGTLMYVGNNADPESATKRTTFALNSDFAFIESINGSATGGYNGSTTATGGNARIAAINAANNVNSVVDVNSFDGGASNVQLTHEKVAKESTIVTIEKTAGVKFDFRNPTGAVEGNYTFPRNNGTANQVLVTDGATNAQLSWQDASIDWHLTGNAGTTPIATVPTAVGSTNYVGTSDAKNFVVGVNGISRGIFTQQGSLIGGAGTVDNAGLPASHTFGATLPVGSLVWGTGHQLAVSGGNANLAAVFGNGNIVNSSNGFTTGMQNTIGTSSVASMVSGSSNNLGNQFQNSIVTGRLNTMNYTASGGNGNVIAGESNTLSATGGAPKGAIVGGYLNTITAVGNGFLLTGTGNTISGSMTNTAVVGQYNTPVDNSLFIVGNGTSAAAQNNAVTVLSNGNVGIGNSSPLYNLEVGDFLNNGSYLSLSQTGSNAGGQSSLTYFTKRTGSNSITNATSNGWKWMALSDGYTANTALKNSLFLQAYTNGVKLDNVLVANPNGNVGFGTSTPSNTIHVVATANPARLEGLQTGAATDNVVVADGTGVLKTVAPTTLNANDWHLTGNAGTTAGTNFLGTTDAQSLLFKVNNIKSGLIGASMTYTAGADFETSFGNKAGLVNTGDDNIFVGAAAGIANTTGRANTVLGSQAFATNVTGEANVAIGAYTLYNTNKTSGSQGSSNMAVGTNALFNNTTGSFNSGIGDGALYANTTGNWNTANGQKAIEQNTTGSYNTGLGALTDVGTGNLTNATAVGALALVEQSNSLVLGSINGTNAATADVFVGIGTTTPSNKLHVKATTGVDPVRLEGLQTGTATDNIVVANTTGVLKTVTQASVSSLLEPWQIQGGSTKATSNNDNIYQTGSVAIGASTIPTTSKLYVSGNIETTGSLITSGSVYADYVFEKYFDGSSTIDENYTFKPLTEVNAFIKKNKHLPGVTPISEVNKTATGYSFDISKLSMQSLEKIEELYLHTIEQQTIIEKQQAEIQDMKTRLERLESLLLDKK